MPKRKDYQSMLEMNAANAHEVTFHSHPLQDVGNQHFVIPRALWNDLGGPRMIIASIYIPAEPEQGW